MSDLSAALRADGHDDLADQLEAKELAGRLRQSGRNDLADALEAGQQEAGQQEAGQQEAGQQAARAEPPRPLTPAEQEQRFAEQYRDALNAAITPSFDASA